MERCIAASSPDRVSALSCRNIATVKIREHRGEGFKRVSGRDFTILLMCDGCATDVLANPRFSVLEKSPNGFTSEAWNYDLL